MPPQPKPQNIVYLRRGGLSDGRTRATRGGIGSERAVQNPSPSGGNVDRMDTGQCPRQHQAPPVTRQKATDRKRATRA
jgi:hypothetical protein